MPQMQIHGDQVQTGTVPLNALVEAVIQADGGQAFTANQSMGGFRLTNLGTPTAGNDATTKTYVDDLVSASAAGLDPKQNVRASSTAAVTLATDVENGDSFGGVTLATGDRILLMHQASAVENGIWVVAATGSPTRAADSDGTPSNEVTLGNYVFVTQGTNGGKGFWLYSSNATAPETSIVPGTDTQLWQQFNAGSAYTASNGITLNSADFQLNLVGLGTATIVTADSLPFVDASDTNNEKVTTVANFLADLDIPNGITANGVIVRTAADTYASRTITGTASRVSVTNGDGVAGNPTIDIDAAYVGQASITTLGTITTGTWNGTTIAVANGGTGATSLTANALLYGNGTSAVQATTNLRIDNANNEIQTADQTAGTTNSAAIRLVSGDVSGATSDSGSVTLASGASSTSGNSGALTLNSGETNTGDSGGVTIYSGAAVTGSSGQLLFRTGAASVTAGNIVFQINGASTSATIDAGGIDLASGKTYQINNVNVLTDTALGASVVSSSLTSVGTLTSGAWNASTIGTQYGGTGLSIVGTTIADGDLLIGSNAGDAFVKATLTAGTGISITNGAGSITIALTESGMVAESDFVTDDFTGDGSTTVFNLSGTAAAATNALIHAYINGVRQKFTTHFTATTTAVTFTSAPTNGHLIQVSYITA